MHQMKMMTVVPSRTRRKWLTCGIRSGTLPTLTVRLTAVFHELAEKHPNARGFLKQLHIESEDSPEFRAYLIRVTQGFDIIINLLEEPLVLEEQIHYLADKYGAKVGLKKSYFEAVADAFEHVLPQVSTCFNIGAWNRCLRRLAHAVSAKVADD